MSLIDRLKQLVGPGEPAAPAPENGMDSGAGTPARSRGHVRRLLTSVKKSLADFDTLAGEQEELETQLRYWNERLRQAERMVERETAGTPAALRASEQAGAVTARLAEMEVWKQAVQQALESSQPTRDESSRLLAEIATYQDRARAVASELPAEEAAAEAALTFLGRQDPAGGTSLERLQELDRALREAMVRAEANRPAPLV